MARSNQTKATATPATTSARRTRSSPLNSEDPPDRDSRRPRTSAAASNTRNNQNTQQNDGDDAQDEESDDDQSDGEDSWKVEILAGVRAVLTVREAKDRIKTTKNEVRALDARPLRHDTQAEREKMMYELEFLRQRRDGLRAARPQTWTHDPKKWWSVRGIKNERGNKYLIAWKPSDGVHWEDSWQKKDHANAKAKRDWNRRKGIEEMREYVDGPSDVE
ncbi:hypothetical protein Q7P36_011430 [Cladosporium allicinum]